MSSKSTLINTGYEHWYRDCQSRYYESTKEDDAYILEFDAQHKVETDSDGTRIIIEKGSDLYIKLQKVFECDLIAVNL